MPNVQHILQWVKNPACDYLNCSIINDISLLRSDFWPNLVANFEIMTSAPQNPTHNFKTLEFLRKPQEPPPPPEFCRSRMSLTDVQWFEVEDLFSLIDLYHTWCPADPIWPLTTMFMWKPLAMPDMSSILFTSLKILCEQYFHNWPMLTLKQTLTFSKIV